MSARSEVTKNVVRQAFEDAAVDRTDVRCEYCQVVVSTDVPQSAPTRAVGDHRIPVARGGSNRRTNIAVVCNGCNHRKGVLTDMEYLAIMHNAGAVRRAASKAAFALQGHDVEGFATYHERKDAKRQRRESRLADRIRIPDANCTHCGGTGRVGGKQTNHHVRSHLCPCSLVPLSPEQLAAHVNGRGD